MQDGERALTDLRHLGELAQAEAQADARDHLVGGCVAEAAGFAATVIN